MNGLDLFDPATGRFTHYQHNPADPASLGGNQIVCLYQDNEGTLWIGLWDGGLSRLDPGRYPDEPARFVNYRHDPADSASLSNNDVLAIIKDHTGTLWVGTQIGLNKLDYAHGTFTHYWMGNGLPNDTVNSIVEDAQGYLWLGTNHGLSKFDPHTETFRNYDANDGLQSNEFDSNAAYRAKNGELYFGGVHGFNVFRPEEIQDNPMPPPVVVTRFSIFNQPVTVDLSAKSPVQLAYRQNFFAFEFAALDYHAPLKNQYTYKLEGFDQDWVNAGTRRYAGYTNLPGGQYTFRVKGSNNDGVWNETGVAIPLHITPPFWLTWWFKMGLGILAVLGSWGLYWWRTISIRAQNKLLEQTVTQRTAELRQAQEELARRADEELAVSEARFQAVFDSAAVGMGIMGMDGKVITANPALCRMYGRPLDELVGQTSALVVHPDEQEEAAQSMADLLAGRIPLYTTERRYVRKNGEVFWAHINLSVVHNSTGEPRYIVGMVVDIDEKKRVGEKLAAQEAEYRRTLEQHVEERTRELATANIRLVAEMEQRQRAEEALARKAADEAVIAERTRLARDLHDAVTQTLFSASLTAEVLPDLWAMYPAEAQKSTEELRQLTRGALAEMRTLLLELRPSALTEARLEDLLRQLTEAIVGRARLPVEFTVEGQRQLPVEVKITFYRIAQEAMNNVVKYARAGKVRLDLRLQSDSVRLVISDDGVGFDPHTVKPTHLGLKIMRERAEAIQARLGIHSEAGHGTIITAIWRDPESETK